MRVKLTLLAAERATFLPLNYNHAVAALDLGSGISERSRQAWATRRLLLKEAWS
jgi:hypothetical protein